MTLVITTPGEWMATKGQKSPLTRLGKAIEQTKKRWSKSRGILVAIDGRKTVLVSISTLNRWLKLAEAPDARFRLDGSASSKRTKTAKSSKG